MDIHDQKQDAVFLLILRARLIKSSATNRILIDCNASGGRRHFVHMKSTSRYGISSRDACCVLSGDVDYFKLTSATLSW
jgi:hypothetical protein